MFSQNMNLFHRIRDLGGEGWQDDNVLIQIQEHGCCHYPNYLYSAAAAAAKSLQSCPALCDPIHG